MLRPDSSAPRARPEFKGARIDQLVGGRQIVVNIDGDWQSAVLTRDARVTDGKLELNVTDMGGAHHTVRADYVPDLVEYGAGMTVTDSKLGTFTIRGEHISRDGHIAYDITTDPTLGRVETLRGIPQEYIRLWNETIALENALETLQRDIDALTSKKAKVALQQTFDETEAVMNELYKKLPDPKKLSSAGHAAMESSKATLEALRTKAADALNALQRQVAGARVSPDEVGLTEKHRATKKEREESEKVDKATHERHHKLAELVKSEDEQKEVDAEIKRAADAKVARLQTEKDTHDANARTADSLAATVDRVGKADFERLKLEVIDEKLKEREQLHVQQKTIHNMEQSELAAGTRTFISTPDPGVFNHVKLRKVIEKDPEVAKEARARARALHLPGVLSSLSPEIQRAFDDMITMHARTTADTSLVSGSGSSRRFTDPNAARARYLEEVVAQLKRPYTDKDKKLSADEEAAAKNAGTERYWRTLMAQAHFADLRTEVQKRRLERARTEADTTLLVPGRTPPEYSAAAIDRVNAEIAPTVIADWKKDFAAKPEEALKAKEQWFDFDEESARVHSQIEALIKSVTDHGDGSTPKKGFERIYTELVDLRNNRVNPSLAKMVDLPTAVRERIHAWDNTTHFWSHRLLTTQAELNEARKGFIGQIDDQIREYKAAIHSLESKDESVLDSVDKPIDLSSFMVEKMFEYRRAELEAALRQMYLGNAVDAFREIVPDIQPTSITTDELEDAGIRRWDDFKKRWDTELAAEVAETMEQAAKHTLLLKVAERMNSLAGAWEKMKAAKGQIAARVIGNALLVGGGSLALSELAAKSAEFFHLTGTEKLIGSTTSSDAIQGPAKMIGGALSGAVKWFMGTRLFNWGGQNSWNNSVAHDIEIRQQTMQNQLIDSLVQDTLSRRALDAVDDVRNDPSLGTATHGAARKRGFFARLFGWRSADEQNAERGMLGGEPMFASVIAETVRAKTAKQENHGLTGSNRLLFERMLSHLDTKTPDEAKVKELAQAIAAMQTKSGMDIAKLSHEEHIPFMDRFLKFYSGSGTMKEAMLTNAALAGIFFVSGTARAAFGGFVGAVAGWDKGEALYYAKERRNARQELTRRIGRVQQDTRRFHRGLSDAEKQTMRGNVLYLKRFLHGTLPPEELSAAVYVVAGKQGRIDELLLKQISSVVYEADKTHVFLENDAEKAKLDRVLAAMRETSKQASEVEYEGVGKRFGAWIQKTGYKVVGAGVGAVLGGGSAYVGGKGAAWIARELGFGHAVDMSSGRAPAESVEQAAAGMGAAGATGSETTPGPVEPVPNATPVDYDSFRGSGTDKLLLVSLNHLRDDIADNHGLNTVIAQDASTMAADMEKALTGYHRSVGGVPIPRDIHSIAELRGDRLIIHDNTRFQNEIVRPFAQHARNIHGGDATHYGIESKGAENLGGRKWGRFLDAIHINEKSDVHNVGLGRAEIGASATATADTGLGTSTWHANSDIISGPDNKPYATFTDDNGKTVYRRLSDNVLYDESGRVVGKATATGDDTFKLSFKNPDRIKAGQVGAFVSAETATGGAQSEWDKATAYAEQMNDKNFRAWMRVNPNVQLLSREAGISPQRLNEYIDAFKITHREDYGLIADDKKLQKEFINGLMFEATDDTVRARADSDLETVTSMRAGTSAIPELPEASLEHPVRVMHDKNGGDWVRFYQNGKQHTIHLGNGKIGYDARMEDGRLVVRLPGADAPQLVTVEYVNKKPLIAAMVLEDGKPVTKYYSVTKGGLLRRAE